MKQFTAVTCLILALAGAAHAAQPGAPVRVFDAGELTLDSYTVIKRLWTGAWRASFWIPAHEDAGSAIAALAAEAGSLGANGIINLHCVNDKGGWGGGYTCYGSAIRFK